MSAVGILYNQACLLSVFIKVESAALTSPQTARRELCRGRLHGCGQRRGNRGCTLATEAPMAERATRRWRRLRLYHGSMWLLLSEMFITDALRTGVWP